MICVRARVFACLRGPRAHGIAETPSRGQCAPGPLPTYTLSLAGRGPAL